MSIGRKVKLQLLNPHGKWCWFNASIFATLHVSNECEIDYPDTQNEQETLSSQLKVWQTLDSPEVLSPFDAIGFFVGELLPDTTDINDIRENTQEALLFFQAVAGQERLDSNGQNILSFMRPTALTQVEFDKCSGCYEIPGKSKLQYVNTVRNK